MSLSMQFIEDKALDLAERVHQIELALFPRGSVPRRVFKAALSKLLWRGNGKIPDSAQMTQWSGGRSAASVHSIVLLKLDHIGDMVMAIPAARIIRNAFPSAHITLVCGHWNAGIAKEMGIFDDIVALDVWSAISGQATAGPDKRILAVKPPEIESLPRFDIAVDLRYWADTRPILRHIDAGFKAGYYAIGMADDLDLMMPRVLDREWQGLKSALPVRSLTAALASCVATAFEGDGVTQDALVAMAGCHPAPRPWPPSRRPLIGIHTGCGSEIHAWPIGMYRDLAAKLLEAHGGTVVLFGDVRQKQDAEKIAAALPDGRVLDMTGKFGLGDFCAHARSLDLYIGNDTGTTHLIGGIGVPTICVFTGGGSIAKFRALGPDVTTLSARMPCAPCIMKKPADCPYGFKCATDITVARVAQEAAVILARSASCAEAK